MIKSVYFAAKSIDFKAGKDTKRPVKAVNVGGESIPSNTVAVVL